MVDKNLIKYLDETHMYPTLAKKLEAQMPNESSKENLRYLIYSKDSDINYEVDAITFKEKRASKEKDVIINYYLQVIRILFLNKYITLKDAYICVDIIRTYCGELKQGNYYKVMVDMKYSEMEENKDPMKNFYIEPDEDYYYSFIDLFKKDYAQYISDNYNSYIEFVTEDLKYKIKWASVIIGGLASILIWILIKIIFF